MEKPKKIIFSGGGFKGLSYIGSLKALENNNLLSDIDTLVGTSIGSLISLCISLKYSSDELKEIFISKSFKSLQFLEPLKFYSLFGIDTGIKMVEFIKFLITNKLGNDFENITLSQLFDKSNINLIITSVCLETQKPVYFNYESDPNLKVYQALRMSMGIPFLYTAIKYKNKTFVDGGIIDNFPIGLFNMNDSDILGFSLCSESEYIKPKDNKINSLYSYITSIVNCVLTELEFHKLSNYKNKIVFIDTSNFNALDFEMNESKKLDLINIGFNYTSEFIKSKNLTLESDPLS